MPSFSVTLELGDLLGTRFERVDALVDTGPSTGLRTSSTFTSAPTALLERLGIRAVRRQRFRLGNGQVVENDVADARVRLEGMEGTTPVIFGEPGEEPLLGAVTLETFLLAVDPVNQRLIPVDGLRMVRQRL